MVRPCVCLVGYSIMPLWKDDEQLAFFPLWRRKESPSQALGRWLGDNGGGTRASKQWEKGFGNARSIAFLFFDLTAVRSQTTS